MKFGIIRVAKLKAHKDVFASDTDERNVQLLSLQDGDSPFSSFNLHKPCCFTVLCLSENLRGIKCNNVLLDRTVRFRIS